MTVAYITEAIDSVNNKLNFITSTFLLPYLEDEMYPSDFLQNLGISSAALRTKGIVRFKYTSTFQNSPVAKTGMDTYFGGNVPVASKRVVSMINEQESDPNAFAFEYVGYINVPVTGAYTFGINGDDAADVMVGNTVVAAWYGSHTMNLDGSTPGGTILPAIQLEAGQYPLRLRFMAKTGKNVSLLWKSGVETTFSVVPCDAFYHNPSEMDRDISTTTDMFDPNDTVANMTDYNMFSQYFGPITPAVKTDILSKLANIHVSFATSNFTGYSSGSNIPTVSAEGQVNGDVNFHAFLTAIATNNNGNHLLKLQELLIGARVLYNILDDKVMEAVKSGTSVAIQSYSITSNRLTTVQTQDMLTSAQVRMLSKLTRVEYFILRRICLLLELVIHSHICMKLFEIVYVPAGGTKLPDETKMSAMLVFFVSRLKALNSNFGNLFETVPGQGNPNANVVSSLYDNIKQYNSNSQQIDNLDDELRDAKINLKSERDIMTKGHTQHSKMSKVLVVAFILFIIVLIVLAGFVVSSRMNPSIKYLLGLGCVVISCVITLAFYWIRSNQLEGFETGIYNPTSLGDFISSATSLELVQTSYQIDFLKAINAYLQNSINLALILQNNNAFKYINYNLQKELRYYNDAKVQIDNASNELHSTQRMYDLEKRQGLSKLNLFIALIIIITVAIVAYTFLDGVPSMQYIVLGVTSVLLLMVAMFYILDTQSKVRTDGSKMYWGRPAIVDSLN